MAQILREEHGHFGLNCDQALWATGDIHDVYHTSKLHQLCDVDFAFETEDHIILVEYKNACTSEAKSHSQSANYNPLEQNRIENVIKKYFDSLHYLRVKGKNKTTQFVFVVEYPKGDSTSRKMLRNRLKKLLPFRLQEIVDGETLIDKVAVLSIDEWNQDPEYGHYPIESIDPEEVLQ